MGKLNNAQQNTNTMSAKNDEALQSALEEAEQALAGDSLQQAVQQKKSEQQFK